MKIFISGSRSIKTLDNEILKFLDDIMNRNWEILIGDCYGVDSTVQSYLNLKNYTNVTVYHVGNFPRNNIGAFNVKRVDSVGSLSPREYYTQKDVTMTADADVGIVIWDGMSKGSLANKTRLESLGKKVVVYTIRTVNNGLCRSTL